MRLEFSVDLAECPYPSGRGKPPKGNNSCALKTATVTLISPQQQHGVRPFQLAEYLLPAEMSLWSGADLWAGPRREPGTQYLPKRKELEKCSSEAAAITQVREKH